MTRLDSAAVALGTGRTGQRVGRNGSLRADILAVLRGAVGEPLLIEEISLRVRQPVAIIRPPLEAMVAEGTRDGDADLYCLLPERSGGGQRPDRRGEGRG